MFPAWLHQLAIAALALGALSALVVVQDVWRHPQHMAVMNVVWPTTALFGTVLTAWAYFRYGRLSSHEMMQHDNSQGHEGLTKRLPYPVVVGKGALHCGAGCMLGDLVAEWLAFAVPGIAIWFGWQWLFGDKMFAVWVIDFVFAFALGIVFQYWAIQPMRHLSFAKGIVAAVKADALSLISWQLGMYGFMAFAQFYLFEHLLGMRASVATPEFWFAMQIAMIAGFVTAYPVNWFLIATGMKEKM